ncbi:100K [Turkey adenovirus 3]|nr:100K [Avirulent turkey hemorrhagic enteritis virus]QNN94724.1 100K [Turkey adenovirus 3]QNN94747.1 100K [Turkey adenovirus 3]QNN94782.1 100K [Turkey adenovirus 3]QNN94839.1 100K [Turkey adenovirus 3]
MASSEEVVDSAAQEFNEPFPPAPETLPDSEVDIELMNRDLGEFETNSFSIHLRRQAQLCKLALQAKFKYLPESVAEIGDAFESFIFNPITESDRKQQEPRLNFYPPFAVPERTATYNSFFQIMSLPFSCLANRSGSKKYKTLKSITKFEVLPKFESDMFVISDCLGSEVSATDSLPRKTRLVNLQSDNIRLMSMKEKLKHVTQFAYPALNIPPKIYKTLIETLYKPIQQGEDDESDYVFSDDDVRQVFISNLEDFEKFTDGEIGELTNCFRKNLLQAIQYVLPLKLMQGTFRHPCFVKKLQEMLHYTFHHGYIKLISSITGHNLSKYITFHCMTYENNNNNPNLHTTLDLNDGEDYMVDTIFLYLIMTWQTAMGVWQQNINEKNLASMKDFLTKNGPKLILCRDSDSMADMLADWITDGGVLLQIFRDALPDFMSQTQLNNFRTFILARSNIVSCMVSTVVKDFVPLDFKESPPQLWPHVYCLRLSYFFYNHGDYQQIFYWDDNKPTENEIFCYCNLCAPHRTPMLNTALHNEILAIGSFDFFVPSSDGKGGERVTLTPGLWANKFLNHFVSSEYFPFEVKKYVDHPECFKIPPTACVITKPEILSSLKEIKKRREKFLIEKGSGIYLDPQTGDNLSDAKIVSQPRRGSSGGKTEKEETAKKNPR